MKNESRKKTERMNAELASHIQKPISGHQKEVWAKARSLKRSGLSQEEALAEMSNHWGDYHKDVSRAVRRAAERVYSGGFVRGGRAYPPSSEELISKVVQENPFTVSDLKGASPCAGPESFPTWGMLQLLFPSDALICMGESPSEFKTKPLEEFADEGGGLPLIVPRTMASRSGLTLEGKRSERCNENAGPLRYVVVEFDDAGEDEQACLHRHLSRFLPLVLVLHSGGKSLHAWYNAVGASEERVDRFKRYAAGLGADTKVFVPSQMLRMPNAIRPENGELQRLLYFDNGMLPSKAEGEAVIDFEELPLAPEIGVDEDPPRSSPRIEEWHDFEVNCPPEPPELIEGFLHVGCKAALAGQSKAGKSHLAKQLAHAVATGGPFLGMDTLKTPVLYLNLELAPFAFRKRFSSLVAKMDIRVDRQYFHLVNGRGSWSGIHDLAAMIDRMIELGVKLIIVDPFYKIADLDESDQAAVKRVLRVFDQVVEETGASVLYVHHFGKGDPKDRNPIDLLSGSGVLARDYDSCLMLVDRGEGKSVAKFILRNHKPKDDLPLANDYPLKIPDESAIGCDGGRLDLPAEASSSERYSVEDVLSRLEPEEEVASKDLRERVEEECGMGRSTYHALVKEATSSGDLRSRKDGNRKLYSLPTGGSSE